MRLPFAPPLAPMLSSAADALPGGEGWQFEPKWDGFRTLVFRDGEEILLQSRDERPMNRYFPELVAPLAATLPERSVVDGEIVIVGAGGLDFEALLLRIHPAASRVKLLSRAGAGLVRGLGPARAGRSGPARGTARGAARTARAGAGGRGAAGAPLAGHARSGAGRGLVPSLRGRRARWRHGQAPRRALSRRRAHDDQGEARAHGRLRGRRLPLAQEGRRHHGRLAPARPVRRQPHAAPCRRRRRVHQRGAQAARRRTGAAARERARRPSLARLGGGAGGSEREGAAAARGNQPVESGQGSELGAAPARARLRGRVRPHAGVSLPACRAVPALAPRQAPARLPLRSAGSHARLRARARLRRTPPTQDHGRSGAPRRALARDVRRDRCGSRW